MGDYSALRCLPITVPGQQLDLDGGGKIAAAYKVRPGFAAKNPPNVIDRNVCQHWNWAIVRGLHAHMLCALGKPFDVRGI